MTAYWETAAHSACNMFLSTRDVLYLFSPKPASVREERYLFVINRFFSILKLPNNFRMKQLKSHYTFNQFYM